MAPIVSFSLQYPWQAPVNVTASVAEPLIDVLERNGYIEIDHYEFFVAVGGALVNPEFTVSFCGVRSGSRVVLLQRRVKDGFRARQLLRSLSPQSAASGPDATKREKAIARRREVVVHMADRSFITLDGMRKAPIAYTELYRDIEGRLSAEDGEGGETITEFDAAISEAPLPTSSVSELST
jgi:hypothetical protein